MKVMVASAGKDISSQVHETFGRCPWFLAVEVRDGKMAGWKAVENTSHTGAGSVGISAAELVANLGAEAVMAKRIGPKAMDILTQFGIAVYISEGTVGEAIGKLIRGELKKAVQSSGCGDCPK